MAKGNIKGTDGEWKCNCGNTADRNGFFPCDPDGKDVEPVAGQWDEDLLKCDSCGAIISCAPETDGKVIKPGINIA
jgi:hypothetical protein